MSKVCLEDLGEDELLALAKEQRARVKRLQHALADVLGKAQQTVKEVEYLIEWANADWAE